MSASTTDQSQSTRGRTRDPTRKEKIVEASVRLIAQNGFHDVSMADIGAAAGIVGSGVYRHFESKSAILVEVFERVIDSLLAGQHTILETEHDLDATVDQFIEGQMDFVVGNRAVAQVYHNEVHNLPDVDRRRLRRKQRIYVEGWVQLLQEQRQGLDDTSARILVHAAISAIQSSLFHSIGSANAQLRTLLAQAARAVLRS